MLYLGRRGDGRELVSFDWAIKHLLRNKANFDILEGFLSELMMTDITVVELLDTEAGLETPNTKLHPVDVLAKDIDGQLILIEVQYTRELDYFHRIAFGGAKLLTDYHEKGTPYRQLKRVATIHVVYFGIGVERDYLYCGTTAFEGIHTHDALALTEQQQGVFGINRIADVFPQHYLIRLGAFEGDVRSTLDEWVYFLKYGKIEGAFHARNIDKAAQKLDVPRLSPPNGEDTRTTWRA